MRKNLKKLLDEKVSAVGTVERFGLKNEYIGGSSITLLLKDVLIQHNGKEINVDHIWLTCGKTFLKTNPRTGSELKMNCHVKEYTKGYVNHREFIDERRIEIGLNRASSIQEFSVGSGESLSEFISRQKSAGVFLGSKYL